MGFKYITHILIPVENVNQKVLSCLDNIDNKLVLSINLESLPIICLAHLTNAVIGEGCRRGASLFFLFSNYPELSELSLNY